MGKIKKNRSHLGRSPRDFLGNPASLPTRGYLPLSPNGLAAGKVIEPKNINFTDIVKPILRKSLVQFNPRQVTKKGFDAWRLNFARPSVSRFCVARARRREVLFSNGVAGRIKVRFAKWTEASHISCKG